MATLSAIPGASDLIRAAMALAAESGLLTADIPHSCAPTGAIDHAPPCANPGLYSKSHPRANGEGAPSIGAPSACVVYLSVRRGKIVNNLTNIGVVDLGAVELDHLV